MPLAHATAEHQPLTAQEFRRFQSERPDEERWELIDGIPVMMTPPFISHNRIASNLERLLDDALARHDPDRIATQRPGVDLGLSREALARLGKHGYLPEPDVAVIDNDPQPELRYVTKAYLLAEVVSNSDDEPVLRTGEAWIEAKLTLYRDHPHCEVVMAIEQARIEVRIASRVGGGWTERTLTDPVSTLALPTFGLRCHVADLYVGTHLGPRQRQARR